LFVDAGASPVTIAPEIVRALGWEDFLGENTTLRLAGGFRTTAPQLLIPSVSCQSQKAEFVRGIALAAPTAGVDGALGLSFLNRFDFRITRGADTGLPELRLDSREPRPRAATPAGPFDVFISHKTHDLADAREVFDHLTERGYSPFLSAVSLARMGQANFLIAVDEALESARHLVLVASSPQHMMAPYVRGEWLMFRNLMALDRKPRGNIVILLCGAMTPEQVPAALALYEAIPMSDPTWRERLVGFLPR
jgi:hypothetical protein